MDQITLKKDFQDNEPLKEVINMLNRELDHAKTQPDTEIGKAITLSRLTGTIQGVVNFFSEKDLNNSE